MAEPVPTFLAYGTVLLQFCLAAGVALYLVQRFTGRELLEYRSLNRLFQVLEARSREAALLTASVATAGSLYFSNVLMWEPCRLCWYQRIFMYPLVVILAVGTVFRKENVRDFVIPLSLMGLAISIYHYPIQLGAMSSPGCSQFATSCSMTYTQMFGYVTVPMMAATAFITVLVLIWKLE